MTADKIDSAARVLMAIALAGYRALTPDERTPAKRAALKEIIHLFRDITGSQR